jgi:phage antirepressor YoqD-like protein
MTFQEALVTQIDDAYSDVWKYAEMIEEHLDYKPSEATRTPLQLLQEVATMVDGFAGIITTQKFPETFEENSELYASLTSIAACREYYESKVGAVKEAVLAFPSDKLTETIDTPWGTFTWVQFMSYLYWNPMWHAGQLAYIGLIHGDSRM